MADAGSHLCSFCCGDGSDVLVLIAGPAADVFICDECVKMCEPIVFEHRVRRAAAEMVARTPAIVHHCCPCAAADIADHPSASTEGEKQ